MRLVFLFFYLSSISASYAGNSFGNGADVMVCLDQRKSIKSVELLDYYEFRVMGGGSIDLGPSAANEFEKVRYILNRLKQTAPTRAYLYEQGLNNFFNEIEFVDKKLEDIPDNGPVGLPEGCILDQAVAQLTCAPGTLHSNSGCFKDFEGFYFEDYYNWNKTIHGLKRYKINSEFWNKMNSDEKAGLILHELIYREYANILGRTEYSAPLRAITGALSSSEMKHLNQSALNEIFIKNGFFSLDVDLFYLNDKSTYFLNFKSPFKPEYSKKGNIIKAYPHRSYQNRDEVNAKPVRFWSNGAEHLAQMAPRSGVSSFQTFWEFSDGGELLKLNLAPESNDYKYFFKVLNKEYLTRGFEIDGNRVSLNLRGLYEFEILGKKILVGSDNNEYSRISFNKTTGVFVGGRLNESLYIKRPNYELNLVKNSYVSLTDEADQIFFVRNATGFYFELNSKNTFRFLNGAIDLNSKGEVVSADAISSLGQNNLNAFIEIYPRKMVTVEEYYKKMPDLRPLAKGKTLIQFGYVPTGIICEYQGKKYLAKRNIDLRSATNINELPKILMADGIPIPYDRAGLDSSFCQVIKE